MAPIQVACDAMATRFEIVLHGSDAVRLRAAAEEALHEIQRLHAQLSLYSPSSEISAINARASEKPVKVEPGLFRLLQLAQRIHRETGGAFDITIAPLLRCWGFMGASGVMPSADAITEARQRVGMEHVILDESAFTIQFARPGMMLDLGSIGKGYALEVAAELLREAGVVSALLHGGTSTICAVGHPPDLPAWNVAVHRPPSPGAPTSGSAPAQPEAPLAIVPLQDEALSVSGVHGKSFEFEGKIYGHILDPRTGFPAQGALVAAVALPSATGTDALSTALLLGGVAAHEQLSQLRPNLRSLVAERDGNELRIAKRGIELL